MSEPPIIGAILRVRLLTAVLLSLLLGLAAPFAVLVTLHLHGLDSSRELLVAVLIAAVINSGILAAEGIASLRSRGDPAEFDSPPPAGTAVVLTGAGELDAAMITIRALLRLPYPAPLQILVVHHSGAPSDLAPLLALGAEHDRLQLLEDGCDVWEEVRRTARGELVGVFRAGQYPLPGAFDRAWRRLTAGFDAVCGHTVSINGDASRVARLLVMEAEAPGPPSEPCGAGIDQGAGNAYWKTGADRWLQGTHRQATRSGGGAVAFDRSLLAAGPGPTTLREQWSADLQSVMTWQSVGTGSARRSSSWGERPPGQRLRLFDALLWRMAYPWLTLQTVTLAAYRLWRHAVPAGWWPVVFALAVFWAPVPAALRGVFASLLAPADVRRVSLPVYILFSILVLTAVRHAAVRAGQIMAILFPDGAHAFDAPPAPARDLSAPQSATLPTVPEGAPQGDDQNALALEPAQPELQPPRPAPRVSASERLRALELAQQLAGLVHQLVDDLDAREGETDEVRRQLRGLQSQLWNRRGEREPLSAMTQPPIPTEELQILQELTEELSRQPNHIVALASISQHAAHLAEIVARYRRIQEAAEMEPGTSEAGGSQV